MDCPLLNPPGRFVCLQVKHKSYPTRSAIVVLHRTTPLGIWFAPQKAFSRFAACAENVDDLLLAVLLRGCLLVKQTLQKSMAAALSSVGAGPPVVCWLECVSKFVLVLFFVRLYIQYEAFGGKLSPPTNQCAHWWSNVKYTWSITSFDWPFCCIEQI